MDIVCANPIAHQFCSVRSLRRSFASGWTEPSAFYGERLRDIVWGTVAFEKAPQNFYIGDWGWVEFVQVRVLPNFAPSKSAGDRSGAADEGHPPSIWSDCGR